MNALYEQMNELVPTLDLGTFQNIAFATLMGWVAVTIQAVILALVIWWSRLRMKAKKISWWIPLAGAVASNMLSTACIFIALLSDPSFQEALTQLASSK
jgi:type II secretory pathway component PulF